jgi:hypothetical protein
MHSLGADPTAPGQIAYNKQFFSGQNVYVFLYPHYLNKLVPIPVTQMSYGMSQQKSPIYGYASYTWDAVAKGQKIVQGEFSIVFSKPNFIGQLLGNGNQSDNPTRDEDGSVSPLIDNSKSLVVAQRDDLRADIWGAATSRRETDNYLSDPSSLVGSHQTAYPFGRKPETGKPEADYCGHQPFDIIIAFGSNPAMKLVDNSKFSFDTWMTTTRDYVRMMSQTENEMQDNWKPSDRLRIEHVELMNAGSVVDVSGQPLQETYSFIARDMTSPQ